MLAKDDDYDFDCDEDFEEEEEETVCDDVLQLGSKWFLRSEQKEKLG
jgi:hypothetical protein